MNRTVLTAAAALLIAAPTLAQNAATPDVERESQKPAAATQQRGQAVAAAAESQAQPAKSGVTYEQVLEQPDNVDLNYEFAQQQVRDGDLKGAAATLQRILMVNPDLAKVRLLYAVVLYRLDDLTESERELRRERELQVPDEVRREVDKYLNAIAQRRKKTHIDGTLTGGFEYDTNRNASPASGRFLFSDVPLNASGSSQRRDDTSLLFLANVGVRHDLTTHQQLFGSLDYYRSEQTVVKTLNLQAYSLNGGDSIRTPWGYVVKPSLIFDHILLQQTTFLRNRGADLRVEKRLDRRTLYFGEVRDVFNSYSPTQPIPFAADRTGVQVDTLGGVQRVLNPTMRLDLDAGYTAKHAHQRFYQFNRFFVDVSHTWLLPKGTFLISGASLHFDFYSKPDAALSAHYRRDETGRLSLIYGVPLSLAHPKLKDLVGTLNYEYYHAFSNILNYAYTNNKIAALVTYKWGIAL